MIVLKGHTHYSVSLVEQWQSQSVVRELAENTLSKHAKVGKWN